MILCDYNKPLISFVLYSIYRISLRLLFLVLHPSIDFRQASLQRLVNYSRDFPQRCFPLAFVEFSVAGIYTVRTAAFRLWKVCPTVYMATLARSKVVNEFLERFSESTYTKGWPFSLNMLHIGWSLSTLSTPGIALFRKRGIIAYRARSLWKVCPTAYTAALAGHKVVN